jgi:hypothetical protein
VADLVSLLGFKDFLGVESVGDDDVLDALLDAVEELLRAGVRTHGAPLPAAQDRPRRGARRDGLTCSISTTRSDVTSILIGPDPPTRRETLDPTT